LNLGGLGASGHGMWALTWATPQAEQGWAAEHYWQLSDKMQASLATLPQR